MTPPNKGSVIERPAPGRAELQKDLRDGETAVSAEPRQSSVKEHTEGPDVAFEVIGEGVPLQERLIVSPCGGRFHAGARRDKSAGEYVLEGQEIGRVLSSDREEIPVASAFSGWIMGYLVPEGSPVRAAEPVAWLRPC